MRLLSVLPIAALAFISPSASAQSESIFDIPEDQAKSFIDFGGAVVTRETYVGSGNSDVLVLPYVNASYKGRFFINPALGAGVYAIKNDKFRLAASGNLALGRDGIDTPFNTPLFDIDLGVTANVSARYYLPFAAFDVVGTLPVASDIGGARLDALLTTELNLTDNFKILPGVRTTFNTGGWLNSYYGINTAQSAAIALPELDYSGGLSTIGLHSAGYYRLTDDLEIVGVVNYSMLVGDIKDSPLTPSNTGLTAAIAIARKF